MVQSSSPNSSELEAQILERLATLPHGRANTRTLARELGFRGEARRQLEEALDALSTRGALIEIRGNYALPERQQEYATGRLNLHRDGYGFLSSDRPLTHIKGDVFLPPGAEGRGMHGDRVLVRIGRLGREGRAEGSVVRILERAHPSVVGEFRVGRRENYVVPQESRIRQSILIPEGMEMPRQDASPDRIGVRPLDIHGPEDMNGMIVNVEIVEYPDDDDDYAVGRVIEILGNPDDFGVDVEVTIRKFHLPNRFPAEVLEQARSVPPAIAEKELRGRRDFRDLPCVTIDGETARDFDDAVYVDRLPNGNFVLHVHIADVSHYVRPSSPIDVEALQRGTSVYFPDRAVPMLPLELSTDICSLKPGVDRLTMSALLEFDPKGEVVSRDFCRGVIRSAERMTYTNVQLILDGDAAQRERYAPLVARFELMKELAEVLNRRRYRRGSIDFDLPEPVIEFDAEGAMTGVRRSERLFAHRLIEEFMLAANESVAGHLEAKLPESIYRIHEPPDPSRVMDFEELALRFGHTLGLAAIPVKRFSVVDRRRDGRKVHKDIVRADERLQVNSQMYQRLVEKLAGLPEERILNYLMLRSLKQARYSTINVGHFALAAKSYTHFTSPIRRYPDLIVHRLLGGLLDGRPYDEGPLEPVAMQCSDTERRAAEAERDLVEWKKVRFMTDRVGDDFPALVISTMKFGFFIELDDLFVEGLVLIDTLPNGRWTWQENTRKIVAERGRAEIRIGDRVQVRLYRVDEMEKKLLFALVVPEQPGKGRKKR